MPQQLDLIKQDSIGRWWGFRADSEQMKPIGSVKSVAIGKKIHPNHSNAEGIYEIEIIRRMKTGEIVHIGETGRSVEVRGLEWVKELEKKYPGKIFYYDPYRIGGERLQMPLTKEHVRSLEKWLIEDFRKIHGRNPGFERNGKFIETQKVAH